MDDGPATMEHSLEMARIAVKDGIRQIVATPHVMGKENAPDLIRRNVDILNSELRGEKISLEILPGADVYGLLDVRDLKNYTINGSDYLLFEFPHSHLPPNAEEMIFAVLLEGLKPIITHPERNPSIIENPERLFDLIRLGALVQVTADSLTGHFGPEARECAAYLIRKNAVHFLATDAHSPESRKPVLSRGLRAAARLIGKEAANRLVFANPAIVLSGKILDV